MNTTKSQWHGIDANNEISLFEYGILVREDEKNSFTVVYSIGNDKFDTASITNTECNYLTKESWFELDSFLSFVGCTSDEFYNQGIASKLQSMLQYYGYENIFGGSWYGGMNEIEVRQITDLN